MSGVLTHLGDMPVETFLREYWQQKALLVRKAIPDLPSLLSADELAGLACEPEVESRIIKTGTSEGPWQLMCGPFEEQAFAGLGERDWTLLVQAVDQWVPGVSDLMRRFHFLPSWRTDDIMISYAADNGSVGPHYDHYDVFLLQLEGRRRWQVGSLCNEDSPTLPGTPLKVLAEFAPLEDWTLEPGDMLYLPPRLAHWGRGVGVGCMTLSVGFRAPSVGTLLQDWAAEISPGLREDQRFEDPERVPVVEPACIESEDIDRLQALLVQLVSDRAALASWFGKLMTEPKYPDQIEGDDWPWIEDVMAGADLVHHPGARFAWSRSPAMLFASGEAFAVPAGFAALVAGQTVLDMGALQPWWQDCDCLAVLNALVLSGSLQVCSVQSGDEQELGARCYPAG